jgi:hypothetical protein
MSVFSLTIQPTYYKKGFFNVTVEFDGYVRDQEGPVTLILGDPGQRIEGRIDRKAKVNGTARVMGGTALRDRFQANLSVMDEVNVELGFPDLIRLKKPE